MTRLRTLFLLVSALAVAVAFAACGGSSSSSGSSDVPPKKVLDQTFSGKSKIHSGKVDASLKIQTSGQQSGTIELSASGPFDDNGSGDAKLDMTAKASGDFAGQNVDFQAGAIFTGSAGFINYQGTNYQLSPQQYTSLTNALSASSSSQGKSSSQGSLPGLKDSLTNLTNEGTTDVEGTNTIHVSGDIDPSKLVDAIRQAIAQRATGGTTPLQLQQLQSAIPQLGKVSDAIKQASFDIYSGADDHLLRKLDFTLDVAPPKGNELNIEFDLTLSDVNKPQTVSAPSSSEPFNNLVKQFAPLLGAISGQGAPAPTLPAPTQPGGGTGAPAPSSGANSALLQCLQSATTAAEIQACASK